jgi:hypothetical protein
MLSPVLEPFPVEALVVQVALLATPLSLSVNVSAFKVVTEQ